MNSNPYDPKLLEAWFRFMAEATKAGSSANEMFQQTTGQTRGSAPPNFAEMMTQFYSSANPPATLPANLMGQPEAFNQMTETWLASFGMVPKSRYDALETKYEELLSKFKDSERTVQALRASSAMGGEQTKELLQTWEDTVQKTLQAQTAWWQSWSAQQETGQKVSADDASSASEKSGRDED